MTFLKNTRDRINADYAELVKEFPELLKEPEKLMETLSPEESLALRYLYIAMPVSDMANYDCEVFMDSVKQGVCTESMKKKSVPAGSCSAVTLLKKSVRAPWKNWEVFPQKKLFWRQISGVQSM